MSINKTDIQADKSGIKTAEGKVGHNFHFPLTVLGSPRQAFTVCELTTNSASLYPFDYTSISDTCGLGATFACASVNSHPCYYQSWITGAP